MRYPGESYAGRIFTKCPYLKLAQNVPFWLFQSENGMESDVLWAGTEKVHKDNPESLYKMTCGISLDFT